MKWLSIIFIILLITLVVASDRGDLPGFIKTLKDYPGGDKAGHFVLMGILSFLVNASAMLALPRRKPVLVVLGTSLIIALVVSLEEYSQKFFVNRTSSMVDLVFSYLGIACFSYLTYVWKTKQKE